MHCIPVWLMDSLKSQGSSNCIITFSKPFKRLMPAELLSQANDTLLSKPALNRPKSLSNSVSQLLFSLAMFHGTKCLLDTAFSVLKWTERHTHWVYAKVRFGLQRSKPCFWNRYLLTCMCELVGFCNIQLLPWPMKTLLSLGSAARI